MASRKNIRLAFLGILVLILSAAFYDFPSYYNVLAEKTYLPKMPEKAFSLGLDLQGGTHLIYKANMDKISFSERADAVAGVRDVLERRVNAFGVSEPNIQTSQSGNDWNVIVELAGVTDANEAIKMIGETPYLDFRIKNTSVQPTLNDEEKKQLEIYNTDAEKRANTVLKLAIKKGANFDDLVKLYSEETNATSTLGITGFSKKTGLAGAEDFEKTCFDNLKTNEVSTVLTKTPIGYLVIKKLEEKGSGDAYEANCQNIFVKTKIATDIRPFEEWLTTELSGQYLKRSQLTFNQNMGEPEVSLQFDEMGKEIFKKLTTEQVGNYIGIFLDGTPISVPKVNEPIVSGDAVISGGFTANEAKLLAQRLNAGALRVPIELISQETVGPTLGKVSVEKSIKAALIGLLFVIIFMVLYYRIPGLIADIALICYALLNLAVFKSIPVTLTVSGIAGFILTVGMAVDANILVFERMREELKRGLDIQTAIDEGFKRAWPSISDGNYSTIITAAILVWFSSSSVKGFGITLIIGTILSIFSAMVITRVLMKMFIVGNNKKWLWFLGVKK